jgi:ABC-type uncharacterized transport system ATPase subunit
MLDVLKREGRILRKMRIKEKVIKMIEELPEDITVSDVMAELYFRQNVDEGLKELDEGKGISHEEAKKRLSRWLTHGARNKLFVADAKTRPVFRS